MENYYSLKLFVAGNGQRAQAICGKLQHSLMEMFPGEYQLQVVNVLEDPDLAQQYDVFATPTLLKDTPLPASRVIGKLEDTGSVLQALHLTHG
jgi:circadian clock protein KaiB